MLFNYMGRWRNGYWLCVDFVLKHRKDYFTNMSDVKQNVRTATGKELNLQSTYYYN